VAQDPAGVDLVAVGDHRALPGRCVVVAHRRGPAVQPLDVAGEAGDGRRRSCARVGDGVGRCPDAQVVDHEGAVQEPAHRLGDHRAVVGVLGR
jgi:hypothetical protein